MQRERLQFFSELQFSMKNEEEENPFLNAAAQEVHLLIPPSHTQQHVQPPTHSRAYLSVFRRNRRKPERSSRPREEPRARSKELSEEHSINSRNEALPAC